MKSIEERNKKAEYDKIYHQKNKLKLSKYQREYYRQHKSKVNKRSREWQVNHPEKFKEITKTTLKRYRDRLKLMAFCYYSGGDEPFCSCCGEKHIEFLTLDHIDGKGAFHRKDLPHTGSYIYLWAKRNNYPPIFQVLCFNCNFAKGTNKICPHQKE